MTVKGRDGAAIKQSDGFEVKLDATALGYLCVKPMSVRHGLGGRDRLGWTHPVTAGCGIWKEMDNGKGRKAVRRQEAQIAITPARRALSACSWHMVNGKFRRPSLWKWPRFCRTHLLPFGVARLSLQNPCRRRRLRMRGGGKQWLKVPFAEPTDGGVRQPPCGSARVSHKL